MKCFSVPAIPGVFFAVLAAWVSTAAAQPQAARAFGGSYNARVSYLLDSPIRAGSRVFGDIDTFQSQARYVAVVRPNEKYSWRVGMIWERLDFGLPASVPLPNSVQGLGLVLGDTWRINDSWTLLFDAEPGIYSDWEDVSWGDVNMPTRLLGIYTIGPKWQLAFAAIVNPRNQIPVVGGVGVLWRPSERWSVRVILPQPRVEYRATDKLTFYGGGEFNGGAFRTGERFGTRVGNPQLNDQDLSYRDVRAGGGVLYKITDRIRAQLEAGWVIDRRFNFNDRNLLLNSDGAPYFTLSISGSY